MARMIFVTCCVYTVEEGDHVFPRLMVGEHYLPGDFRTMEIMAMWTLRHSRY